MDILRNRRAFLVASGVTGTGFLIGCRKDVAAQLTSSKTAQASPAASAPSKAGEEPEVTAVEDLCVSTA